MIAVLSKIPEQKACLHCNRTLWGRIDKRFCGDRCRNYYNNRKKARGQSKMVREIAKALLKNRKLLAALIPGNQEAVRVSRTKLNLMGFQFKYHTHIHITPQGRHYVYCFDIGYLSMADDYFLIVKQKVENSLQ